MLLLSSVMAEGECNSKAQIGGVCFRHGAKVKLCSTEGCTKQVKKGGVYYRHRASRSVTTNPLHLDQYSNRLLVQLNPDPMSMLLYLQSDGKGEKVFPERSPFFVKKSFGFDICLMLVKNRSFTKRHCITNQQIRGSGKR